MYPALRQCPSAALIETEVKRKCERNVTGGNTVAAGTEARSPGGPYTHDVPILHDNTTIYSRAYRGDRHQTYGR